MFHIAKVIHKEWTLLPDILFSNWQSGARGSLFILIGCPHVVLFKMTQNIAVYKSSGIRMTVGPKDNSENDTIQTGACTVLLYQTYYPCHTITVNTCQCFSMKNCFYSLRLVPQFKAPLHQRDTTENLFADWN